MALDPMTARLKCLRLAEQRSEKDESAEMVVAAAKVMSDYVIGEPIKSSASFGKAGADDPKK